MKSISKFIALFVVLLTVSVFETGSAMEFQIPAQELKLDNGLVVIVVERPGTGVFSSYIVTAVGSANEKPGSIGAAHFLEHMLFKGTKSIGTKDYVAEQELMDKQDSLWNRIDQARQQSRYIKLAGDEGAYQKHLNWVSQMEALLDSLIADEALYVVKNEYEELYTRRGAVGFNASTGYDFTDYIVSLPANQLHTWFVMEADRMKNPVLREFYPEREVVLEERRLRIDNEGEGKLFEQFIGTAFIAHPYQLMWEWKSDQGNIKREALKKFHHQFYAPNRTVIGLVGDIKFSDVEAFAKKYWSDIPRQPEPDPIYTVEPKQLGERRVDVNFDASPALYIGFHKGAFDDPDEAAFVVLDRILADGRSSRLYKSLVIGQQLCSNIGTEAFPGAEQGDLYPSLYIISAYPKDGVDSRIVETAIYEELAKLSTVPVSARELQKARNNIQADFIWDAYDNDGLAQKLAQYQSTARDWRYMLTRMEQIEKLTPDALQSVAAKYFTKENRTVATLVPIVRADATEGGE